MNTNRYKISHITISHSHCKDNQTVRCAECQHKRDVESIKLRKTLNGIGERRIVFRTAQIELPFYAVFPTPY